MTQRIIQTLSVALEHGASDVFISEGQVPAIRLNGQVGKIDGAPEIPAGLLDSLLGTLPGVAGEKIVGPYADSMWRMRYSRGARGKVASFRPLLGECPTLEALGVPPPLFNLLLASSGLVLFGGKPVSGKTISATAFVSAFCKRAPRRAVFLDPAPEYEISTGESLVVRSPLGENAEREMTHLVHGGVDLFWFGDLEKNAREQVLYAANSGALTIATLSGNSSSALLAEFSSDNPSFRSLLAATLRAIVMEYLLPSADGSTLVSAWEIVLNNQNIAEQIRNGNFFKIPSYVQAGASEGMLPLDVSLSELVRNGSITKETALTIAFDASRIG